MNGPTPTILLIDPDAAAARELGALLLEQPGPPRLLVSLSVEAARGALATDPIDWLFIRISEWDDYQLWVRGGTRGEQKPRRVVFLSGRAEKCTDHLSTVLDAHLQPPYRASHLRKVWNRLSGPAAPIRSLDFFFLKTHARYVPVRYPDLYRVRRCRTHLEVQTRHGDYPTTGSLSGFQARLPIPLAHVRRGWLVNEAYEP